MGERLSRVDDSPWTVTVSGEVDAPRSFSIDELRSLPQVQRTIDIHCVTRWSKPDVQFRGVLLAELVAHCTRRQAARHVSFVARTDRCHSTSLAWDDAVRLGAIVALQADGQPLPAEHGGPVRMVVPDRYFYKSLKWLERVELLAVDRLGTWEADAGYHNTADPALEQRYIAADLSKADAARLLRTRDLSGRNLLGLDARGRELSDLNARNAVLRNADFRGCRLQGARFDHANLTNACLQGADLRRASLRGADLSGADFAGADLRGACLSGASLVATSFLARENSEGSALPEVQLDRATQFSADSFEELTPDQRNYLTGRIARASESSADEKRSGRIAP